MRCSRSGGGFVWGRKFMQNPLEHIELSGITRRWTTFSAALMAFFPTTLNENDARAI
jgi:phage terminase large subunit-like protein